MGRVPEAVVEEILRKSDIAAVIGRAVTLKRQGHELLGICPFHNEKSPSFYVNPEKGVWHCHGCGAGGSLVQFVMRRESMPFPEAIAALGKEVGIEVKLEETDDPAELQRRRQRELLERCSYYYHRMLMESPVGREALHYLNGRGVDTSAVVAFRLGWAPAGGQELARQLTRSGYTAEEGVAAGVLRERQGRIVDALRERVTFPIYDAQDRVLAFGGRLIKEGQPKYLNTNDTALYSKRMHLFGLNLHRQAIARADRAIVVEGYLDAVMLHLVGIPLAVASLGTSLTLEQVALLRRYTKNVVMAYDADRAGQAATLKAIELFEQAGLRVSIAPLPQGEDPDSLARKGGKAAVEEHLSQALGVVDYHIARCEREMDLSTPEGKEDFYREIQPAIERIQDPVKRDAYVRRVASKLQVTESKVAWKLSSGQAARPSPRLRGRLDPFDVEARLFRVLAFHPQWIGLAKERLDLGHLTRESLRPLFATLFAIEGRDRPLGVEDLLPYFEDEATLSDLTQLLIEEPPASSPEDVHKLVKTINDRSALVRLERLKKEIVQATEAETINSDDERFQEYIKLQRQLKGSQ